MFATPNLQEALGRLPAEVVAYAPASLVAQLSDAGCKMGKICRSRLRVPMRHDAHPPSARSLDPPNGAEAVSMFPGALYDA